MVVNPSGQHGRRKRLFFNFVTHNNTAYSVLVGLIKCIMNICETRVFDPQFFKLFGNILVSILSPHLKTLRKRLVVCIQRKDYVRVLRCVHALMP